MTANQLKKKGVDASHVATYRQLREAHLREVIVTELDSVGFGKSLRRLREDANISLREMARILKVSAAFLSDCELGHRTLKIAHGLIFVKTCLNSNDQDDSQSPDLKS